MICSVFDCLINEEEPNHLLHNLTDFTYEFNPDRDISINEKEKSGIICLLGHNIKIEIFFKENNEAYSPVNLVKLYVNKHIYQALALFASRMEYDVFHERTDFVWRTNTGASFNEQARLENTKNGYSALFHKNIFGKRTIFFKYDRDI